MTDTYPSDSAFKLIMVLLLAGFMLMLVWGWYKARHDD